jgi:CRISPR/Cas system CSM-associated protein Csm4 (group 5 of RAMP superfamily)
MAYDAGIGGKGSQGFGCIEVKKRRWFEICYMMSTE